MEQLFRHIDKHQDDYVALLGQAVAIKSVSAWPENRPDVCHMMQMVKKLLEEVGAECNLRHLGFQDCPNGSKLELPPVLLGQLGSDADKPTLLVYGHLDVQPALKEDGWDTEPFVLTEVDGKLYGRGATDDKGPVLDWINAIQAMNDLKMDLPVNVKFIFEGMEESDSVGLDELVISLSDTFLKDIDYVCISDNYWLGRNKPCVTYGLRHEAMSDVIALMGALVDSRGRILVPGVLDKVKRVSEDELSTYSSIDFDLEDYRQDVGVRKLLHDRKEDILMHRWRFPSLSFHGIEGAFSGTGFKTVIPHKVIGKFSIRLVPDQIPDEIEALVKVYLTEVHDERQSPNLLRVTMCGGALPWVTDYNHANYAAGRAATKTVFGVEPDLTREGGSIPVTLTFQEATGKSVILLPIGGCDDGAHSQNEKINRSNYINGVKLLAAYMDELGKVGKAPAADCRRKAGGQTR